MLQLSKGSEMSFDAIQHLIKSVMGLSPESIGAETIKRIVERRMAAVGIKRVADYYRFVEGSADELQSLINEVTVPETWFFRDHEPFKVLSNHVCKLKLKGAAQGLRFLSVPCSTGEEPYSIAMVLRDAGLGVNDFKIDAVDISTKALGKAQSGLFGGNSFRGKDVSFRDKYFDKQDKLYAISDEIKNTVRFHKHNILADHFMLGHGPYDVVFCRNLLIYFDYETKCKVLKVLHNVMEPEGLLFLGHAETGRMPPDMFESLRQPGSFAYRKLDGTSVDKGVCEPVSMPYFAESPASQSVKKTTSKQAVSSENHAALAADKENLEQPSTTMTTDEWIGAIQKMADQGRLKEALTECDRLISAVPDSAQAYYLKGVVLLAFDADPEAVDAFKKAVYLDPKHYQSLIHLSVLAEEQGDFRASENFRARADRLRDNGHDVDR